eukprot:11454-Alexandrium_andersonii.AAC.1
MILCQCRLNDCTDRACDQERPACQCTWVAMQPLASSAQAQPLLLFEAFARTSLGTQPWSEGPSSSAG